MKLQIFGFVFVMEMRQSNQPGAGLRSCTLGKGWQLWSGRKMDVLLGSPK